MPMSCSCGADRSWPWSEQWAMDNLASSVRERVTCDLGLSLKPHRGVFDAVPACNIKQQLLQVPVQTVASQHSLQPAILHGQQL